MHNQNKILRVLQLISLLKAPPAKSIHHLSKILSSTERTVYRYLDLLTEVGFFLERDDYHRIFIASENNDLGLHFTTEETRLLKRLVLTVGKNNPLKDGILKKLYINSEMDENAVGLLKAHLSRIIEELSTAIQTKKQVVLKQYHSVNSNEISDRLVEPIKFTDNFQNVAAYEPDTGKNKFFKVERISGVEITRKNFRHEEKHKFSKPDAFGFSDTGRQYHIDLLLSLRASVLMKEEYPMTAPFITNLSRSKQYRLTVTVYDLKPITRFILGMLDEITILGSDDLRNHLQEHVVKVLNAGKKRK